MSASATAAVASSGLDDVLHNLHEVQPPQLHSVVKLSGYRCVGSSRAELYSESSVEAAGPSKGSLGRRELREVGCTFQNLLWTGGRFVFVTEDGGFEGGQPGGLRYGYMRAEAPASTELNDLIGVVFDVWNVSVAADWLHTRNVTTDTSAPAHTLLLDRLPTSKYWATSNNPGHFLADYLWPHFRGMASLSMLDPDNQLIYPAHLHHALRNCSFGGVYLSAMSKRPARSISSYSKPVWFPRVAAGIFGKGSVRSHTETALPGHTALLFRTLARTVLGNVDARPGGMAGVPRIRLRPKVGDGHRFLNNDLIIPHLRHRYPRASVEAFVPMTANREHCSTGGEVKQMMETDIYITPAGGGSYGAVYLPTHATAIFGSFCWPCNCASREPWEEQRLALCPPVHEGNYSCCGQSDSALWDNMPNFHARYYYHLDRSTLKSDADHDVLAKKIRNHLELFVGTKHFAYPVAFDQLDWLVDKALFRAGFADHIPSGTSSFQA